MFYQLMALDEKSVTKVVFVHPSGNKNIGSNCNTVVVGIQQISWHFSPRNQNYK